MGARPAGAPRVCGFKRQQTTPKFIGKQKTQYRRNDRLYRGAGGGEPKYRPEVPASEACFRAGCTFSRGWPQVDRWLDLVFMQRLPDDSTSTPPTSTSFRHRGGCRAGRVCVRRRQRRHRRDRRRCGRDRHAGYPCPRAPAIWMPANILSHMTVTASLPASATSFIPARPAPTSTISEPF
jgi:hypothetical protein